jgi:hypothetical protein
MRITTIAIGYGFALSSTFAPAQAGGGAAGGSAAGSSAGSPGAGTAGSSGTAMSGSGSSTGRTAGSANGPGATTNPSGSTIGAALPDPQWIYLDAYRSRLWHGTLKAKAPEKSGAFTSLNKLGSRIYRDRSRRVS